MQVVYAYMILFYHRTVVTFVINIEKYCVLVLVIYSVVYSLSVIGLKLIDTDCIQLQLQVVNKNKKIQSLGVRNLVTRLTTHFGGGGGIIQGGSKYFMLF